MPRTRMQSRKLKHRGGRVAMPIEYYGGKSGRYFKNKLAGVEDTAYGTTIPQSFGEPIPGANAVGPNMGVYPGGSALQTGGSKKKRTTKKRSLTNRVRKGSTRVYRNVKKTASKGLKRLSKLSKSVVRKARSLIRKKGRGRGRGRRGSRK